MATEQLGGAGHGDTHSGRPETLIDGGLRAAAGPSVATGRGDE
ncbi:hypothetical protein J2S22_003573 [Rhodoplanes tepidamans]|nr:hypothetical protein [Rhodoplanes tepidamans]